MSPAGGCIIFVYEEHCPVSTQVEQFRIVNCSGLDNRPPRKRISKMDGLREEEKKRGMNL